jgi:hypothetical protein
MQSQTWNDDRLTLAEVSVIPSWAWIISKGSTGPTISLWVTSTGGASIPPNSKPQATIDLEAAAGEVIVLEYEYHRVRNFFRFTQALQRQGRGEFI